MDFAYTLKLPALDSVWSYYQNLVEDLRHIRILLFSVSRHLGKIRRMAISISERSKESLTNVSNFDFQPSQSW